MSLHEASSSVPATQPAWKRSLNPFRAHQSDRPSHRRRLPRPAAQPSSRAMTTLDKQQNLHEMASLLGLDKQQLDSDAGMAASPEQSGSPARPQRPPQREAAAGRGGAADPSAVAAAGAAAQPAAAVCPDEMAPLQLRDYLAVGR